MHLHAAAGSQEVTQLRPGESGKAWSFARLRQDLSRKSKESVEFEMCRKRTSTDVADTYHIVR